MKKLLATCFILASLQLHAGTALDIKIQGEVKNFLIQNNMVKVVTGKTTPWILLDIGNKKVFIVQDNEKKYVEVTKAELENMVKAASSIQDVFGKGKIDFKALSAKKNQEKPSYINPLVFEKITAKKDANTKVSRFNIKENDVTKGEAVFSSEVEKNLSGDVSFKDLSDLIINISTSKAVQDKMTAEEKLLLNVFEKGNKTNKIGVLTNIKQKEGQIYEIVKSEKKDISAEEFAFAKTYTKKSLREFMDGK